MKTITKIFEVNVNGNPVKVKATPFEVNDMQRYRVSYNGSPVHIFGWDVHHQKLMVIDSASNSIPLPVESAIAEVLQQKIAA